MLADDVAGTCELHCQKKKPEKVCFCTTFLSSATALTYFKDRSDCSLDCEHRHQTSPKRTAARLSAMMLTATGPRPLATGSTTTTVVRPIIRRLGIGGRPGDLRILVSRMAFRLHCSQNRNVSASAYCPASTSQGQDAAGDYLIGCSNGCSSGCAVSNFEERCVGLSVRIQSPLATQARLRQVRALC